MLLLLQATRGGGAAATSGALAASRLQMPTAVSAIANNYTSRRHHYASPDGDVSNLQFVEVGFYLVGASITNSASFTFKKYVEYPANTFTQVLYSGSGTGSVAAGGVLKSDPVAGLTIPAGAKFWERTVILSSTGNIPPITFPAGMTTLGIEDGNSVTDQGNSGTIPATSNVNTIGSTAILGTIAAANPTSYLIAGDSITYGQADATSSSNGNVGYPARATGTYPCLKIAVGGQTTGNANTVFGLTPFIDFMAAIGNCASTLVVQLGINDVAQSASQATVLSRHQALYTNYKATLTRAIIKQTTLTPRTDSTDAYATVINQTSKTDGNMANLASINDALRAVPAQVSSIIEAADAAMSARNSNLWGGPFPPVADGVHPLSAKTAAMATALGLL